MEHTAKIKGAIQVSRHRAYAKRIFLSSGQGSLWMKVSRATLASCGVPKCPTRCRQSTPFESTWNSYPIALTVCKQVSTWMHQVSFTDSREVWHNLPQRFGPVESGDVTSAVFVIAADAPWQDLTASGCNLWGGFDSRCVWFGFQRGWWQRIGGLGHHGLCDIVVAAHGSRVS
eukprot:1443380-Rhodomonas_salina.1